MLQLWATHTHSLSLSLSLSHLLSLSLSHLLTLSLTQSLSLITHSLSLTLSLSHSLSLTYFLSHSLTYSLSLSLNHSLSSLTLSHSLSHTHSHSLFPSLTFSHSLSAFFSLETWRKYIKRFHCSWISSRVSRGKRNRAYTHSWWFTHSFLLFQEQQVIRQYHYNAWPDHGRPSSPTPIIRMIEMLRYYRKTVDIPVVVHCSAGCGRTGTILAIDIARSMLLSKVCTASLSSKSM